MAGTFQLLTEAQRALVMDERALLTDMRDALARHGAAQADLDALDGSIRQLDDLFLLVVVGEFNAGKSAFINALVGQDVCEEGVTPTTSRITVLRYADVPSGPSVDVDGVSHVTAPIDLLRTLHIVDTPGTNAVMREHEALTQRFVPRADLVLFLTSSDRPFTESERTFLERIRDWGKKVVVIVNKVDILDGPAQVDQVLAFVADQSRRLLGVEPSLFAVSSRLAKQGGRDTEQWSASGFLPLEQYLEETLDDTERVRLKLRNPLGVGQRAAASLGTELQARMDVLNDDVGVLKTVEQQIATHSADIARDFEYRMADIDKLLVEMERRGHDHFDQTLRLTRVPELLDRGRVQRRFEEEVVADTPQRIERKVNELIDWLVDSDLRQWQSVTDLLAERRAAHRERLPGATGLGTFHTDRGRLLDSVGRDAQRVVETYDRAEEARTIAEKARSAVTTSAAIEVGAAGLGAVVAAVASTAAADLTGLAMAGVIATLGLLVIPNRRHRAKRELREKVSGIRERLSRSLRSAFEEEQSRSRARLQQGVEPYSRFVTTERDRLSRAREELAAIRGRIAGIDARIAALA